MIREVIAVDDSKPALARIKKAVSGKNNVTIRTYQSEDDVLDMIGCYRKNDKLPVFFIDLNVSDNESGYRILKAIRRKQALRLVPVVIVSNSDDTESINMSYRFGANAYHIKSGNRELTEMVDYWLSNSQDVSVVHKRHI